MAEGNQNAAQAQHNAEILEYMFDPQCVGRAMSSPDEAQPHSSTERCRSTEGSGLRGTQGEFGDVEGYEQRHALHDCVRWCGCAGYCGRSNAGKDMMAISMRVAWLGGLPIFMLRVICWVIMRLHHSCLMVLGAVVSGMHCLASLIVDAQGR